MELKTLIFVILFLISGFFYYNFATSEKLQAARVIRVVDGDTLQLENGMKVRLKGINTPESNQEFYAEAKDLLGELVGNKTVRIESHGSDKYGRILAYVFVGESLVNEKIVEAGLATAYFYERDSYYDEIMVAEESARENELGLWKSSPNSDCVSIVDFQYVEPIERCTDGEFLILRNSCGYDLGIVIKDDATHIYEETVAANSDLEMNFSCIWNDDGDTIYVSDSQGLLIFYRYN